MFFLESQKVQERKMATQGGTQNEYDQVFSEVKQTPFLRSSDVLRFIQT